MTTDMDTIINLIENGKECDYLDFKAKSYVKEEHEDLIKDIMSMANSMIEDDKYIITGIKDKPESREVIGIDYVTDSASYKQLIINNIEPEIKFDYFTIKYKEETLEIFKIYDNTNRPYMMKKQYKKLNNGLCYIRKGTQQYFAQRSDFDDFYKRNPKFKVPNSSERSLVLDKNKVLAVIRDGVLIKNVGDFTAYNVEINLFLNVLITNQEFISVGDISPSGDVSLSKLDQAIENWKQDIINIKSEPYSRFISHGCSLLIQFDNHNGDKYFQTMEIGISWAEWERERRIDIGSTGDDCSNEPLKVISNISFEIEIQTLEIQWNQYIEEKNIDQLSKIDDSARELAWKIYSSGLDDATTQVNELFKICRDRQAIGRGLFAYDHLSGMDKNELKKVKKQDISRLTDYLVCGANALKRNNIFRQLEESFWELIRRVEPFEKK
jgi:hypothetical protein